MRALSTTHQPFEASGSRGKAGGDGLVLQAGDRPLSELLDLAAAASRSRIPVRLTCLRSKPIEDLIRIAVTGGDCVVFEPDAVRADHRPRRGWFSRA